MTAAILAVTILFLFTHKIASAAVVLNEIMANVPSGEREWVELYNTSSTINASGWIIEEKTGSDLSGTKQHPLPDFTLQSNGFWTFDFTIASLNNSGDIITLKDNSGTIIDTYQYSSSTQNKTFGRQSDGGSWTSNLNPSKNSSNGGDVPSPSPTPTTSSTSTGSTSSSSFTISNIPSQVNSDQSFSVAVNLSLPNNPDTTYYLAGAFKIVDGTRYFGLTKKDSSWVQYSSANFSNQYKITTNSSGTWTGDLEVKPDLEDSDYKGSGDYTFKVARYTQTGSQTWSNESNTQIAAVENTNQDEISSDSSSSTTAPSSSPQSAQLAKTKSSSQSKSSNKPAYHSATVAAATTSASPPSNIAVKTQRSTSNFITWIGTGLILTGTSLLAYIYLRSRGLHETISNLFRKRN